MDISPRDFLPMLYAIFGVSAAGYAAWRRVSRAGRIQRSIDLIVEYNTVDMASLRNKVWSNRDTLTRDDQNLQQVYESMAGDAPLVERELFYEYLAVQAFFRRMALIGSCGYLDRRLIARQFTHAIQEWMDELFEPFSCGVDEDYHEQRSLKDLRWLRGWLEDTPSR